MTPRDEIRHSCFEAMCEAYSEETGELCDWNGMRAAFDAMHGIVSVVSHEITGESLQAGIADTDRLVPYSSSMVRQIKLAYRAMIEAGDLTNPPEKRP